MVPSDYMVKIMIAEGIAQKIDVASMPNFKNVMSPHDNPSYDPGRQHSAPYMWGTTGIHLRLRARAGRQAGGELEGILRAARGAEGQVAALNDQVELYNAAAFYLGVDRCTEDPKVAQQILELLQKQKPYLAMYQSDGTIERMIAKEVVMHHQWNGASHRTREGLPSAVYVYPKEGVNFWADNSSSPRAPRIPRRPRPS